MSLTADQINDYEDNGYVSPIDVLSKTEANEIREEIEFIEKKMAKRVRRIRKKLCPFDIASI